MAQAGKVSQAVPESIATPDSVTGLEGFCEDLFSSFTRSDQRKWGLAYVRGLVSVPGRKTIRRISDQVVGWRADQSLQQFVNQSPWGWDMVRRNLTQHVVAASWPQALVVEEVVFPKNGESSVGVARQFAPTARRTLNCQLGLVLLLVSDKGSVPVTWRLQLPKEWDEDVERRAHSRVPDVERCRPRWARTLDMIDEVLLDWGLPVVPVLIDARHIPHVEFLLHGLEERDVPYLAQIPERTPVIPAMPDSQPQTAMDLLRKARKLGRMTMTWREDTDSRPTTVQIVLALVRGSNGSSSIKGRAAPHGRASCSRARRVLAIWTLGRIQPDAVYLTNQTTAPPPEVVRLIRMRRRSSEDLACLYDECGLTHFEGRSYVGWHHHVTLVSVAHAYRVLRRVALGDPRI
jgi:hypothetical protein